VLSFPKIDLLRNVCSRRAGVFNMSPNDLSQRLHDRCRADTMLEAVEPDFDFSIFRQVSKTSGFLSMRFIRSDTEASTRRFHNPIERAAQWELQNASSKEHRKLNSG